LFNFSRLMEKIREYTENYSAWGIIRLIMDLLLVIAFFYMLYRILRTRAQGYRIFLLIFIIVLIYLLSFIFQLSIFLKLLEYVFFWGLGIFIIVCFLLGIGNIYNRIQPGNKTRARFVFHSPENQFNLFVPSGKNGYYKYFG